MVNKPGMVVVYVALHVAAQFVWCSDSVICSDATQSVCCVFMQELRNTDADVSKLFQRAVRAGLHPQVRTCF